MFISLLLVIIENEVLIWMEKFSSNKWMFPEKNCLVYTACDKKFEQEPVTITKKHNMHTCLSLFFVFPF